MTHKLYKTKEKIESWLNQYEITDYELIEDSEYGYVVNVNDKVNLYCKKLEKIKIKFNIINGSFDCGFNYLKSLKGCPKEIKGNFWCNNNELTTIKYFPQKVDNKVYLENNIHIKEIEDINDFYKLYLLHKKENNYILNKKLENKIKINIDKNKRKIKL